MGSGSSRRTASAAKRAAAAKRPSELNRPRASFRDTASAAASGPSVSERKLSELKEKEETKCSKPTVFTKVTDENGNVQTLIFGTAKKDWGLIILCLFLFWIGLALFFMSMFYIAMAFQYPTEIA